MRIGLVSTYPPMRCGIGLYTQHLARALAVDDSLSVFVAAEIPSGPEAPERRVEVQACYSRNGDYRDAIFRAVTEARCDVVHVQNAPELFGEDERMPSLLARFRGAGIPAVATLHTVHRARRWRALLLKPSTQAFHRSLAESAHLVLHQDEAMAGELEHQGIGRDRISIIPHGTTLMNLRSKDAARRRLGIPEEAFLFTFFGFLHRMKGVHTALEGFLWALRDMPRARLLIAGMAGGDSWYNHLYVGAMRRGVELARAEKAVSLRDEYIAPDAVPDVYAASDVILLPYKQNYGSASGVFHQAIGSGRPVLCSRGPKFAEARALFRDLPSLTVEAGSARAWAAAMRDIYGSPSLRARASEAVTEFAESTSWPKTAARHVALYRLLFP